MSQATMCSLFHVASLLGILAVPVVTSELLHTSCIFSPSHNDHNDSKLGFEVESQAQDDALNSITDEHPEFYPRSNSLKPSDKVFPAEHLAQKAYGESGEKWKVLGYSETTGYPIIDMSEIGIDTSPNSYIPTASNKKASQNTVQKKPMSYSEIKGGAGLKSQNTASHQNTEKSSPVSSKYYKIKKLIKPNKDQHDKADRVAQRLHMQLHRTQRHETVRSNLYPKSNPPKYRISTETKKLTSFLKFGRQPESKGKYDIRYLDVEKLMDIIVPDAVVLVYKYIRDLPSVPLIYECKIAILFSFVKIIGGFQRLDKHLGKTFTTLDNERHRDLIRRILKMLVRWLFGLTPRINTVEGTARDVEHNIITFNKDLPEWTDKECEGEMDERDWNTFNFHYSFMIENLQFEDKREESRKNNSIRNRMKNHQLGTKKQ